IRLNRHDVSAAVVGEPVLADEHGGVDGDVAVVVEWDELKWLSQIDVAAPVESRLLRILIPRQIKVEIAHGTQHDVVAAIREAVGEILGPVARKVVPDVGPPAARGKVGIGDVRPVPVTARLPYRDLFPTCGNESLRLEDLLHAA